MRLQAWVTVGGQALAAAGTSSGLAGVPQWPQLRPKPQPAGQLPGAEPASWDDSTRNWAAGKASIAETTNVRVCFPSRRQAHPASPAQPGGRPTCAVLVKEARLLRHQRAEEAVPEANVQSGKYEGENAAPNTCGK